jgi:hypothetical protein
MITSRLLFAFSWWTTGTVDFEVIGAVGNLFLVLLCLTLVISAGRIERRVRLGVILAAFMFHLQHYENLLWSGSSIDHFQVVALAVGAIVGLSRASKVGFGVAAVLAVLATFTLAQGLVIWPVGAFMLWRDRERTGFWIWLAIAALTGLDVLPRLRTQLRPSDRQQLRLHSCHCLLAVAARSPARVRTRRAGLVCRGGALGRDRLAGAASRLAP